MRRVILLVACALMLALVGGLQAELQQGKSFKAVGAIKSVDVDKSILNVHAGNQDRAVTLDKEVKVLGDDGKPLADGLKSKELKEGAEVTLSIDQTDNGPVIKQIQLGKHAGGGAGGKGAPKKVSVGKATYGFKPLTEMTAADKYKGEDGGLYGSGKNEPTGALLEAAKKQTAKIVPLDADGKPAKDGKIGLVSISMSNATQEYSKFKQIADADPKKSSHVAVVDCAQGGQAMAQWVNPNAPAWGVADKRLADAHVSPNQVQVIWVKLANVRPTGELTEHGKKLQKDTMIVVQNAKARFPNLHIAYLGSRIYGGWADGQLNPEPYAYEGAFAARWLIQDQAKGNPELAFDDAGGSAKAPLLLWGPYFWGDGTTPRKSDKLVWERTDLVEDGTHPSETGRMKVAQMLLTFFKEDPLAQTWFVKK